MTAWEDQQAQQGEWQDSAEMETAGVPPSPGRSGARWGLQWGAGEGPKPAPAPVRSSVSVMRDSISFFAVVS